MGETITLKRIICEIGMIKYTLRKTMETNSPYIEDYRSTVKNTLKSIRKLQAQLEADQNRGNKK